MLLAARSPLAPAGTGQAGRTSGSPLRWRVLAAFPTALYLHRRDLGVLAVVTSDGLALPTAWRLPIVSAAVDWGVGAGDTIVTTGDEIRLSRVTIRAVRSWRPAQVRPVGPARLRVDGDWIGERIGRGEGLTPEGDDEICGALLVAHAVGEQSLAAPATAQLARTTALSASLIEAAAQGYGVPALVSFVDAVLAGDPEAGGLREQVLAIGHTSGEALVRGVCAALPTPSRLTLTEAVPPLPKESVRA